MASLIAIQMQSSDRVADNLKQAELLLAKASIVAGDLVLLPENFALLTKVDEYHKQAEPLGKGLIQDWLSQMAKHYACYLVAGSVSTQQAGDYYTTALVYSPSGDLLTHYNKIHLFDVDLATGSHNESAIFNSGQSLVSFQMGDLKVGLAICFDLRFSYIFQLLKQQCCDVLLLPAAFTAYTGKAHWKILLQARAIETQCYMLAANQTGQHFDGRQTYGHSMVVDPWGTIIAEAETEIGSINAALDSNRIQQVRAAIPLAEHPQLNLSWRS